MVAINFQNNEIVIDLVYFGPPSSGKKTWIRYIHEHSAEAGQLDEHTFGEKTLRFQRPVFERIKIGERSYDLSFNFVALSYEFENTNPTPETLRNADGIVFIADSSPRMTEQNIRYRDCMKQLLNDSGIELTDGKAELEASAYYQPEAPSKKIAAIKVPWVLACNKRDLTGCRPLSDVENDLKIDDVPVFECIATEGIGVYGTFKSLEHRVMAGLSKLHLVE